MKKTLLILVIILTSMISFSQEVNIKGRIISDDREPIENANIKLEASEKGAVSSSDGSFIIYNVKSGTYTLKVSSIGYKNAYIKVSVSGETDRVLPPIVLQQTSENLQEVVVSGNNGYYKKDIPSSSLRLNSRLQEIPQNIQIIGNELIKDQIAFSLFDGISRNVSGARRVMHDPKPHIYMRGFRSQSFRNGMNIDGYFGPMKDDASFIERFEYVKGPAGFMMTNTSPGGIYNAVTKKPTGMNNNTVSLTLGSFQTYRAEADIEGTLLKSGKLLYRINTMGKKQGTHTDYGFDNGYSIAPSFTYKFSDRTKVTMEYIYQYNEINNYANYIYSLKGFKEFPVNTSYSDARKDPIKLDEHNVFVNLQHNLNDRWKLTAQASYLNFNHRGTQLGLSYNSIQEDGSATRFFSLLDNNNTMALGQVFINGSFSTGRISHKIVGGLDMGHKEYFSDWSVLTPKGKETTYNVYNPKLGQKNLTTNDFPKVDRSASLRNRSGGNHEQNSYSALYFQDEIGFVNNRLRLSLGGRYTNTKRVPSNGEIVTNNVLTPRIGISFDVVPSTTLYWLLDQTFEENYGLPLQNGAPLKPSRGTNLEFGIKNNWFKNKLNTTLTAYQITKNNVTTTAGVAPDQYSEQFGEVQSKGVEFDLVGEVFPQLHLVFNYAFNEAKIKKDIDPKKKGSLLPGSAKHISNTWLTYRFAEHTLMSGAGISIGYQLQKDRVAWPTGSGVFLPDDFFSLDAGVSYKVQNYQINLVVNNITNHYNYTGFYPGAWGYKHYGWRAAPPRNFRLQLTYSF